MSLENFKNICTNTIVLDTIEISIYSNMDNSVYTCIYKYFDMQIYSVQCMYIKDMPSSILLTRSGCDLDVLVRIL